MLACGRVLRLHRRDPDPRRARSRVPGTLPAPHRPRTGRDGHLRLAEALDLCPSDRQLRGHRNRHRRRRPYRPRFRLRLGAGQMAGRLRRRRRRDHRALPGQRHLVRPEARRLVVQDRSQGARTRLAGVADPACHPIRFPLRRRAVFHLRRLASAQAGAAGVPGMKALGLIASVTGLLALRQPLLVILLAAAGCVHLFWGRGNLEDIIEDMWVGPDKHVILSIPSSILCGNVMTRGSIAQRLIRILAAVTKPLPGGLAVATILSCAVFAAISGSSIVTMLAIGTIMYPAMRQAGYDNK